MNTILYLTDNSLSEPIMSLCQRLLVREAGDLPIVSVSQKPINLGTNICVGEIGRSWYSLYQQLLAGLEVIETDWVVLAEHDCLYTREYLTYRPDDPSLFHYNSNCWLVQWGGGHPELNGMYSYWPSRVAFSQLVCKRDLLQQSTHEVINLLEMGLHVAKKSRWHGEPGTAEQALKAFVEASSGRPTQLQRYLKEYVTRYDSRFFCTERSNLDIRHGGNFTGPKRGKKRTYSLPYWGTFADVIEGQLSAEQYLVPT